MKVWLSALLFFAAFSHTWRASDSTCVLESDFGLIINCAFKKSSLFRIRNLGGIKAHLSWGISIGDELGFKESISNVEINKRRSAEGSKLDAQLALAQQEAQKKKALNITIPPITPENSTSSPLLTALLTTPQQKVGDIRRRKQSPQVSSPSALEIPNEDDNEIKTSSSASTIPPVLRTSPPIVTIETPANTIQDTNITLVPILSLELVPPTQESFSNTIQGDQLYNNTISDTTQVYQQSNNDTVRPKSPRKRRPSRKSSSSRRKPTNRILIAPKEYHPVGYSKNFDENFVSKVKLPKTNFVCKNQKYFPGLYSDEDLGCMVFHVCVALDNGAIATKSFLCPESTLFDQSILKCNWWFYVDCKQAHEHYDVNIPVARSYQIMRALAAMTGNRGLFETSTSNPKDKV